MHPLRFIIVLIVLSHSLVFGQQADPPKICELKHNAKNAFLDSLGYDKITKVTSLTFVEPPGPTPPTILDDVRHIRYYFDESFNFISFEEYNARYVNKFYKGPVYKTEIVLVDTNLLGDIVLIRQETTHTWDVAAGGYVETSTNTDSVKLEYDGTSHYLYGGACYDTADDLFLLALKKPEKRELVVLKIHKDLTHEVTDQYRFNSSQNFVNLSYNMQGLVDSDSSVWKAQRDDLGLSARRQINIVFSSSSGRTADQTGKDHSYTVLCVGTDGKIMQNMPVNAPDKWRVQQVSIAKQSIYVMGFIPMNGFATEYLGAGWKEFQLARVTQNHTDFVTRVNQDEMSLKFNFPASEHSKRSSFGNVFRVATSTVRNGEIMIAGQNSQYRDTKYGHIEEYINPIVLSFDANGKFKGQFVTKLRSRGLMGSYTAAHQYLVRGKEDVYWVILESAKIIKGFNSSYNGRLPVYYPRIARIDKDGNISEFVTVGGKIAKENWFLENHYRFHPTANNKAVTFIMFNEDRTAVAFQTVRMD